MDANAEDKVSQSVEFAFPTGQKVSTHTSEDRVKFAFPAGQKVFARSKGTGTRYGEAWHCAVGPPFWGVVRQPCAARARQTSGRQQRT